MSDVRSTPPPTLPRGIQTYESKSDMIARRLAKDAKPAAADRKQLGEQLIREAGEAFKRPRKAC